MIDFNRMQRYTDMRNWGQMHLHTLCTALWNALDLARDPEFKKIRSHALVVQLRRRPEKSDPKLTYSINSARVYSMEDLQNLLMLGSRSKINARKEVLAWEGHPLSQGCLAAIGIVCIERTTPGTDDNLDPVSRKGEWNWAKRTRH